jgi:polyhydroxyalkanoate synthesis regulator phasin
MKLKLLLIVGFCCLIFSASKSAAQDFKKVIEIVDEMEKSLQEMIAKEETQRKTEISGLQKDIQNLQEQVQNTSTGVNAINQQDFESLTRRISLLENKVNNLSVTPETTEFAGQINQLITELKKVIETSKQTLVPPPLFSIKTGFLAQVQAQAIQEQTTAVQDADPNYSAHWQRQLFIRRLRIILGGDIAKNTTFFFESDAPNIGKLTSNGVKDTKFNMYVQDAYIQHTFIPELSVLAGLQLVGISRNSLQSAASLMGLDFGAYQFTTSVPLDNSAGRDFGINLRGFLFDERLEYRTGMFSGKSTNLYSPFRFASRLNYSFKDKEKGIFYPGTTLGKGEILSVGAGIDIQKSYLGFAFDAMSDFSTGKLGSLTASASLSFLDGGGSVNDSTVFTGSIPKQSILFTELGYFFKDVNLQPYLKYEFQNVNATVPQQVGATESTLDMKNKLKSSQRFGLGVNYFIIGHNANIKLLYEVVFRNRVSLNPLETESVSDGMLTLQLQYFTF